MAYQDIENGEQGGRPVELFHIQTAQENFYICNINAEVVFGGNIYRHVPIRRTELSDSYDLEDGKMSVWMAKTSDVGNLFIQQAPASLPSITVVRGHLLPDTLVLANENAVVIFTGLIATPSFGEEELHLTCTSLAMGLKSVGLRRKFSGNCPHFLFRGSCGVARAAFTVPATVTGIVGDLVSTDMTPQAVGYYLGGMVEALGQFRMITTYTGNQNVVLLAPIQGLQIGDSISLSAGCDHTKEVCKDRFDNLRNFGGWAYVPTTNYFQTGVA